MAAYFSPDLYAGLGAVAVFFCGFGAGWLAKRPRIIEKEVRVACPVPEKQGREPNGKFLCKDGSPGKHKAKDAILEHARTRKAATDWGA